MKMEEEEEAGEEEAREEEWREEEEMLQRDEDEEEEMEAAYLLKSELDLVCTTRSVKDLSLPSGLEDGVLPQSNDLHFHTPTDSITLPALPTLWKLHPHAPSLPFSSNFNSTLSNSLPPHPLLLHLHHVPE